MRGAAAMGEPAHDDAIPVEHLHAIDADVHVRRIVGLGIGRTRDHQSPGDQRRRLARPAGLDRQAAEIDVGAEPALDLAVRPRHQARPGRKRRAEHRPPAQRVTHAVERLGFAQGGEHLAEFADARRRNAESRRHPLGRAEQIGEHRHPRALGVLEQERGTARHQDAPVNLGHLVDEADRLADSRQKPAFFEKADEGAKVAKGGRSRKDIAPPPVYVVKLH